MKSWPTGLQPHSQGPLSSLLSPSRKYLGVLVTTTATATRMSQICIFSGQKKKSFARSVRAFFIFVHSFVVVTSAKQQREIAKFEVLLGTPALGDKFSFSPLN